MDCETRVNIIEVLRLLVLHSRSIMKLKWRTNNLRSSIASVGSLGSRLG